MHHEEHCCDHSKVELFMTIVEKQIAAQGKSIEGIRYAAWTVALSVIGTGGVLLIKLLWPQ